MSEMRIQKIQIDPDSKYVLIVKSAPDKELPVEDKRAISEGFRNFFADKNNNFLVLFETKNTQFRLERLSK